MCGMTTGTGDKKDHYLKTELDGLIASDPKIFDFLQQSTLDGLWYWDLEKPENEWMNSDFWELLGYDPAEKQHLASEWQDLIHPDDLSKAIDNFHKHCENPDHPYDQIVRYFHKNGSTVWVRCRGIAIRDAQGKPVRMLGAHNDLTELMTIQEKMKIVEANLIEERDKALKAEEIKSEFLAVMSHELRTPLNAVVGFSDLLSNEANAGLDRQKVIKFSRNISKSSRAMLNLVNDLLDYAKIEAGKFELSEEPFDLQEELENLKSAFELKAQENEVSLLSEVGHFPYVVKGDATRFRQVLFNLVDNAIKFSIKSHVMIKAQAEKVGTNKLEVTVSIIDSGIGIEESRLSRIFEPFVQADTSITREYGGTGLGLAISRSIARQMGGDVEARSIAGEGATFTTKFQFEDLTDIHQSLMKIRARTSHRQKKQLNLSVLAVDDVDTNLDVIAGLVEEVGCHIHLARNGDEAIKIVNSEKLDVILMDLHMPVIDGITLAGNIQKLPIENAQVPIFAWTADATGGYLAEAQGVDWAGTIIKPTTQEEIFRVLENVDRAKA